MGNTGYAFQIEEKMQGFFWVCPADILLGTGQTYCWELGRSTAGNWAEALLGTGQKHL